MYREREKASKFTIIESAEFAANSSSTNTIAHTIERVVGPSKEAWKTAKHEDDHRKVFRGLGRYAVFVKAEVSLNRIYARWTASFTPDTTGVDTESPEFFQKMINTASIVGNDQSGQDIKVQARFTEKLKIWEREERLRQQLEEIAEKMRKSEEAIAEGNILSPGQNINELLIKLDEVQDSVEKGEKEVVGDTGNIYIAPGKHLSQFQAG